MEENTQTSGDSASQSDSQTNPETLESQTEVSENTADSTLASESESKGGEDWWDTSGLDEKMAGRIKSIQKQYNEKSTELKRTKENTEKLSALEQQYNHITNNIRQTLLSPNWEEQIRATRNQLMVQAGHSSQDGLEKMPQPKQLETVADLQDYLSEMSAWQKRQVTQELDAKYSQEFSKLSRPIIRERWLHADQALRKKYPEYEKYSGEIIRQIVSGPFAGLLEKGMDEKQVLETAFLSKAAPDLMERVKQTTLKSLEKKKSSTTERHGKPLDLKTDISKKGKIDEETKEKIIADLRRSGNSFEVSR